MTPHRVHPAACRPNLALLILGAASLLGVGSAAADERLWLQATVNGKPAKLFFDTGAGVSILFTKGAERLGLTHVDAPPEARAAPGRVPLGETEACDLVLGSTRVRTTFAVFKPPPMLAFEADGAIGWQALSNNILRIDAVNGVVSCLNVVPQEVTLWTQLRVRSAEVLLLEVPKSSRKSSLLFVDTGMDHGVELSPERWRGWKRANRKQLVTLDASYGPSAGLVVEEQAWAAKLDFGPLRLTDVPIQEAHQSAIAAAGPKGFEATLALGALKRMDFIVDGKNGIAYLNPKATPATAGNHNRLGAVFVPRDLQSEDLIAHVVDPSPAHDAKLRNGDVLLKIGELDATKWRTDPAVLPLTRFWSQPAGTKLELTLRRGKTTFKAAVTLREILLRMERE